MMFARLLADTPDFPENAEDAIDTFVEILEMEPHQIWEVLQEQVAFYLPRLLGALLVFAVGHILIIAICKMLQKILVRSRIDQTLHKFLRSSLRIVLYFLLFTICLGVMRIPLAPLVTVMGSAGLALSLALKDSLTNMAGGISVLFSRPFAKGNLVKIKDITGVVEAIDLVYTQIRTDDDKIVFLPNGDAAKSIVVNFSSTPLKRLDFVFSIPIQADFEAAKAIIRPVLESTAYTLKEPEPTIHISGRSDDSAIVSCRLWAREEHYESIYAPLGDEIDRRLKEAGM